VIFRDAPSPQEICSVCHEVVGIHEVFRCICGDPSTCASDNMQWLIHLAVADPGSRPTVMCQTCKFWSRNDCVRNSTGFTCETCVPASVGPSPRDGRRILPPFTSIFPMSDFPGSFFYDVFEP
jgi:hypothetical protein